MNHSDQYSNIFYDYVNSEAGETASQIVPHVLQLVSAKRVMDVGCGQGVWAAQFAASGAEVVKGVDGDYVDVDHLLIPKEDYTSHDLTTPYSSDEQFDLVVSLEVAEHLEPEFGDTFIDTLTGLGPMVLFSAAIPHQTGVHHVNEQWQDFWREKFKARGYAAFDCIRPHFWENRKVAFFYAQNMLLYVREDMLDTVSHLEPYAWTPEKTMLSCVHPRLWMHRMNPENMSLGEVLKALPYAVKNSIAWRLGKDRH